MSRRALTVCALVAVALVPLAIIFLDRPAAEFMAWSGAQEWQWMADGIGLADLVTGREISKWLLGAVLVVLGLALLPNSRLRSAAGPLLFVGTVQLASTLVAGVSKTVFGRLRPFELLDGGDWSNSWWRDGEAFPSGHVGAFAGLFLPLMFLFPRWRWALLPIPLFIAAARVGLNHHWASDVAASVATAAALTLAGTLIWRRLLPPRLGGHRNGVTRSNSAVKIRPPRGVFHRRVGS